LHELDLIDSKHVSKKIKYESKQLAIKYRGYLSQNYMSSCLPLSRQSISKIWKKQPYEVKLKSKISSKLLKNINKYINIPEKGKSVGKKFISISKVTNKLREEKIPCSYYSLLEICKQLNITNVCKKTRRSYKKHKPNNSQFVDLTEDYQKKGNQVIGFDGTHMHIHINDKPVKIVLIFLIHWRSNFILGYSYDVSESTNNIINALINAQSNVEKYNLNIAGSIFQRDLGKAGLSKMVSQYIENNFKGLNSSSHSAFKANQINECMNGWIKHEFKIIYGYKFKNWEEFGECFEEYINWKNTKDLRLKTGTTRLESIKKSVLK